MGWHIIQESEKDDLSSTSESYMGVEAIGDDDDLSHVYLPKI